MVRCSRSGRWVFAVTAFGAAAAGALVIGAGPLNPPAGAVGPTLKTLAEVEPRTALSATNTPGDVSNVYIITQPGSYYLTGHVVPTGGRNAIMVNADHVTIDLSGFALDGSQDATGFRAGITNSGNRRNLVVRNGTIRNFRGYGMIGTFNTSSFEDLAFIDSQGGQLEILQSSGCTVRNVRTRATSGETGIQVGTNCVIDHCTVEGGGVGITIGSGVVRGCSVLNPGSTGIFLGSGEVINCSVEGANSTSSLANAGISIGGSGHVEGCVLRSCASAGVYISSRAEVIGCQFVSCAKGIGGNGTARIEGCQFTLCTTAAISMTGVHGIITGNRFSGNTANISVPATMAVGEVLDFSAGGTLTGATTHPAANIVY
ncbi:MAG: hypothetical protein ACREJO_05605 [Phycisphaerales bacterium]